MDGQFVERAWTFANSEQGDLEALQDMIAQLRTTDEAPFNRPLFWLVINSHDAMWKGAYEAGHWHIIEYLARDLGFSMTDTLPVSWTLPEAVVERASETGSTEEMQRLLDLGWDINGTPGTSVYHYRNHMYYRNQVSVGLPGVSTFGSVPLAFRFLRQSNLVYSRLCMNENLVHWYLAHGGAPFRTVMMEAVGRSPLKILKILIEHGGEVEKSRLVAHAALGDWWGYPDRVSIVNYLLDLGSPIDCKVWSTWPPKKPLYPLKERTELFDGEKTAYEIAGLSGNNELQSLLLRRGASH